MLYLNSRVQRQTLKTPFLENSADFFLNPSRSLFKGKVYYIIDGKIKGSLVEKNKDNFLVTAFKVAVLIPGLILGFAFKLAAFLFSKDTRAAYKLVNDFNEQSQLESDSKVKKHEGNLKESAALDRIFNLFLADPATQPFFCFFTNKAPLEIKKIYAIASQFQNCNNAVIDKFLKANSKAKNPDFITASVLIELLKEDLKRSKKDDGTLDIDNAYLLDEHNFIQRLFPMVEPSTIGDPSAPTLSPKDVEVFKKNVSLIKDYKEGLMVMLEFYGIQSTYDEIHNVYQFSYDPKTCEKYMNHWVVQRTHNFARISRIIKSLRDLGMKKEAKAVQAIFGKIATDVKAFKGALKHSNENYWSKIKIDD